MSDHVQGKDGTVETAQPDANNPPETSDPAGRSEDTAQPRKSSPATIRSCHDGAQCLPDWRWQRVDSLLKTGEAPSGDRDDEFGQTDP